MKLSNGFASFKPILAFQIVQYHAAGEPDGVVGQDGLGGAVVVLGGDGADEALDVELGRAGLLAGGVGAFQTAVGLLEGRALAQGRVLDVVKVSVQGVAAGPKTKYDCVIIS